METFIKRALDFRSLQSEVQGLGALQALIADNNISELRTPQVIALQETELILERLESERACSNQMRKLACGVARIHAQKQRTFGWESDNFIGLSSQINTWSDNWGEFFCEYRLRAQIKMINDSDLRNHFNLILESSSLVDYLNESCSYASLVHGDLWSGNVMFSKEAVYLIDPAVYYGDREVDIAMTEMFGGFSSVFYEVYHEELRLSSEYSYKKIIYNLYHYLNHYNLFGNGYLSGCNEGFSFIKKYLS